MTDIILASGSAIRASILSAAGVPFRVIRPNVDEDSVKEQARSAGMDLSATALQLAETKAQKVATNAGDGHVSDAYIIGSDQILEFQGVGFDKPPSMDIARARLLEMQGRQHSLINATVVIHGGQIAYRHVDRSILHMRAMRSDEIDAYLGMAGPEILNSVGAYMVEKLGARIFDRIEGDHTAVLGLSLYPLLRYFRDAGALPF